MGFEADIEESLEVIESRRSEAEVVHLILQIAKDGADKKKLVKASGLSSKTAERHITMTVRRGLLSERHGLFFVSEKGRRFITEFRRYKELRQEYFDKLSAVRELLPQMKEKEAAQ